jgi:alkylation response protein AidB-like acyl-CoA dehydrogenase
VDDLLSPATLAWRDKAREIAEEIVRPGAWKWDHAQTYPYEVKDALAEAGLFGLWIPKEYGGQGGGVLDLCVVVEELSKACGGVGVMFAVNALGSFPVILSGTEEQKNRYLPPIAAGERLIAFGLSERTAGSDAGSLKCEAVLDGDEYVLNGHKKWNTNGGVADFYSVFAVTDPESRSRRISALMVEKGMPGFSIGKVEDKMGIRCVPVVELEFENVRVPRENLLGGKPGLGFKHAMMTLDHARPGVAAQAVGLAQGALDFALVYTMQREQFGQPIASFQQIQGRLADMSARVAASRHLVRTAAAALDVKAKTTNLVAAQAKLFATETAMWVTTQAVQLFGGYGYMRDYPVEKYMRDAKITQIYEGTNEVQRIVIARNLMKAAGQIDHLQSYFPLPPIEGEEPPEAPC